ncbi:hypothetical protein CRE_18581 [Caenorhabditis remanei]|uniref:Glycosyltransferase family 92 protein n=1 Tax=Caenorhabditis remanei TaxID=31234 RepID=E3LJY2_CAERE|nr:hypothetical protein CRE_18581 [Caenorhabditis remanei]
MSGTNVGALIFENNYVSMNPSIYTSDFSEVSSPTCYSKIGPQKVRHSKFKRLISYLLFQFIFNASVIELCQVHHVESFIDKSKITKISDGALLHLRFNVNSLKANTISKPIRFFPNNASHHIENMHETVSNKVSTN